MDYYYQTKEDITIDLARTASLINIVRAEVDNTLLVNNGDSLQKMHNVS